MNYGLDTIRGSRDSKVTGEGPFFSREVRRAIWPMDMAEVRKLREALGNYECCSTSVHHNMEKYSNQKLVGFIVPVNGKELLSLT